MRSALAVVIVLSAVPLAADPFTCGTSAEHTQFLREAGEWSKLRARNLASKGLTTAAATRQGDIVMVPVDEMNAPFHHPFDLGGRTLVFQRQGQTGFSVQNISLDWHDDLGQRVTLEPSAGENHAVVGLDFDFPFYDRTVRTMYVTGYNAMYLAPPRRSEVRQFGEVDLATEPQAVIAPLLTTQRSRLTPIPEVYVSKRADSVTVTWVGRDRYTVRAVIKPDGEIRFSYQNVTRYPAAASILITSGRESWRNQRATIASQSDPAEDHARPEVSLSAMLDVTGVSVARVNGLDLFEVRIRMSQAFDRTALGSEDTIQVDAQMGGQVIRYNAYSDGSERLLLPVWGSNYSTTAARTENGELVLAFLRDHIAAESAVTLRVMTYLDGIRIDSTDGVSVSLPATQKRVRTDFSAISQTTIDRSPIAEAFTTPVVSVYRVWEQMKDSDPTLTEEMIDGVAIYQTFFTDLVTYAGAYSTGGNPRVSGLYQGDEREALEPRAPALMHMNAIRHGHNSTPQGASRVVLHEVGHRWLMFVSLLEQGVPSRTLNPVSAHPAQYVDTRAAFNVFTDSDTSVMGGGYFRDNGDGSFHTSSYGPYGYSWLDLYLMGLAAPDEVPPMFYIADSDPQLGGEYYAPENETFRGSRRDFSVQQIIDATGKRSPSYPLTQRTFRVVFALMYDPDRPPAAEDIAQVEAYRALLERDFPTATGGRGDVLTGLVMPSQPGPRRRAVTK